MRKIVCGYFGTIYDAEILKSGKMSDKNRRVITDECINAVTEHLHTAMETKKSNKAGYMWPKKDGNGNYVLMLFDDTKYKIVPISEEINKE